MDTKILLNKLVDGNNLSQKEASFILSKIIAGEITPIQTAAVLASLRTKGETADEIAGFIQTMRKYMIKINAPKAIDIVGTGGDNAGTFNISTATSFVVAGMGVSIAKHGNRAISSKCGSADVLEALGININLTILQAEKVFKKVGMVFLFAPLFHPAMKQIGPVRKELGLRTIFNFLGPFLNPARTKKQLLGVPNLKIAKKLAEVATKLKFTHLMLVASKDGMDEITTTSETKVFEVKGNKLNSYTISPKQFGIKQATKEDLMGKNPSENADIIRNILKGKKGPQRDIVILNSAAAFYLAGKAKNINEGIILAKKSIDSGSALQILQKLIKETSIKDNNSLFTQVISNAARQKRVAIIAEIKFASPTNPNLGLPANLLNYASAYQRAGCDAISVITEKHFFNGRQHFVTKVKKHTGLPVLQKDFIIDPYQIYQAKKSGADAILLITRILSEQNLVSLVNLAKEINIEPVVEINSEEDLKKALVTKTQIIAVNARNLDTFKVNVDKACDLLKRVPDKFIKLGFSGIHSRDEVNKYKQAGASGVLIGTSLMKADNIQNFLESII